MNKVTRILTSAVAVGVIAGSGVIGLATPFVHAETISEHVQTVAETDAAAAPWDFPSDSDTDFWTDSDVDYKSYNMTGTKDVRGTNYKHPGEYVYVRITPIASNYKALLKEDIELGGDSSFVLDNDSNFTDPEKVINCSQPYTHSNNTLYSDSAGLAPNHGNGTAYTFKLKVHTNKAGSRGAFVYGHGVKVEYYTYHQTDQADDFIHVGAE